MLELIQTVLPYKVLLSHIILAIVFLALVFRNGWGRDTSAFLGKHAIIIGLLVSIGAVVGSLFYSEIVGFEACVLCWWQRVFLYPTLILFVVALIKKDKNVFRYIVPLVVLAGIIGLYQAYANMGWGSILPCTAAEGACAKVYIKAFGYITIPLMSLTISLYLLVLAWAHKIYYRNENSNPR